MSFINYAAKEINIKIVYYGPGLGGKTSCIRYVYEHLDSKVKGKLMSISTAVDRTLFFDFLPIELGTVKGYKTRFHLYTVPGQVYYNASRRIILRGVDGIIFVADSQRERKADNEDSLKNLHENLEIYKLKLKDLPYVFMYNKRDLPSILTVDELNKSLNPDGVPAFESVAIQGIGVFESLKTLSKMIIKKL